MTTSWLSGFKTLNFRACGQMSNSSKKMKCIQWEYIRDLVTFTEVYIFSISHHFGILITSVSSIRPIIILLLSLKLKLKTQFQPGKNSTSLIQRRPSYNMRINLTQIKRCQKFVFIGNRHKHSPINRRVSRKCAQIWLNRTSRRFGRQLQLRICQVQLRHPGYKIRFTRRRRSDVRVIGANWFTGKFP